MSAILLNHACRLTYAGVTLPAFVFLFQAGMTDGTTAIAYSEHDSIILFTNSAGREAHENRLIARSIPSTSRRTSSTCKLLVRKTNGYLENRNKNYTTAPE